MGKRIDSKKIDMWIFSYILHLVESTIHFFSRKNQWIYFKGVVREDISILNLYESYNAWKKSNL